MTTATMLPSGPLAGTVLLDRTRPLSSQIVDDLKTRMLGGQYPQGCQLPSCGSLAEWYEVSDQVLSNVLGALVKAGWLTKEGFGRYFVAAIIPPMPSVLSKEGVLVPPVCVPPVDCEASQAVFYLCSGCGLWTQIPESVLAVLPAEVTLSCVADAIPLMRLEPSKYVGGRK